MSLLFVPQNWRKLEFIQEDLNKEATK